MKIIRAIVVAGLLLLSNSGCLWSLHPLYTDQDQVFEPGLVGVWASADEDVIAVVKESEGKSYQITYLEDGSKKASPSRYTGRLVRLGDSLFLDLEAEEAALERAGSDGLLATHLLFRVRLQGDVLRVEMVDDELLKEADAGDLRREKLPERYVTLVTASSGEVRAWLEKHAHNPKLYGDPLELRRVK